MDQNPYSPPDHYAARRQPTIPVSAYIVAGGSLVSGIAIIAFGFYYLLPRTTLLGMAFLGVGITGIYFIAKHHRRPT